MPHRRRFAVALAVVTATSGLIAQGDPKPVTIGVEHTLRSDVLDEDRRVLVYTPDSYDGGADSYPVLYLLDGSAHFHHTTGIVDFLAVNDRIPEMIVVGVCNTDRTRDLTPSAPEEPEPGLETAGGADAFLAFLTDELTPWLDAHYRTRSLRVLVGHSFGGLFAVHALQARPNFFRGLVAISPSMQWDDQELVHRTEQWLDGRPQVEGAIFLTAGNEGIGLLGGTHKIAGLLSEKVPPGLRWSFVHMAGETHGSVPHRSTYDGLEFVFDGWTLREPVALFDGGGLDAIREHYARVRRRFGYDTAMPPRGWIGLTFALVGSGRLDDARRVAAQAGAAMPAGVWDFLAGEFADRDDGDGEVACYQDCLAVHPYHAEARRRLTARGVEVPPLPTDAEVSAELLGAYAGRYRLVKYSAPITIILDEGVLHAESPGQKRVRLHAKSSTEFLSEDGAKFLFHRDDDGKAQLSVDVGQVMRCERIEADGDRGR